MQDAYSMEVVEITRCTISYRFSIRWRPGSLRHNKRSPAIRESEQKSRHRLPCSDSIKKDVFFLVLIVRSRHSTYTGANA